MTSEPGVQRGGRALEDSGDRAFAHALMEIPDNQVFGAVELDPRRWAFGAAKWETLRFTSCQRLLRSGRDELPLNLRRQP